MQHITLSEATKRLPYLTLVLIAINVLAIFYADITIIRMVRLLSIGIFLGHYWLNKNQTSILSFFILLILFLRDIALLSYESELGRSFYLILGVLAYAGFCINKFEMIRNIFKSPSSLTFTILLMGCNVFALYTITGMIEESFGGIIESFLFYAYGALMILMGATALVYNHIYNSDRSLVYVLFVICFIISDVTSLFAYYFEFFNLFYVDKIAFILGLGFYSFTALETEKQLEESEQYEMLSVRE